MRWPKNQPLKEWQRPYPVMGWCEADVSDADYITEPLWIFGESKKQRLVTWGRDEEDPKYTPHWIGVRSGTPLHTDPRYPRYTHQLVLHTSGHWILGGAWDGKQLPVGRGMFICLDTHSPHQLLGPSGAFYIAASLDANYVLNPDQAIQTLKQFIVGRGKDVYAEVSGDASFDGG